MRVYGVIPARLRSTRLPRKLLLADTGKTLLQHTWEAASQARCFTDVIIAADDPEIAAAARTFGARWELTGDHPSGGDRVAEVARRRAADGDLIVNVQGDEPEIDPRNLETLVAALQANRRAPMATLATPIRSVDKLRNPACVKVVCAADGRALYFSRSVVPFSRDTPPEQVLTESPVSPWKQHVGVYAYRRECLLRLAALPPSPLEQLEKLEQLRALEAGVEIHVATIAKSGEGIDTPEDYARFVAKARAARRAA